MSSGGDAPANGKSDAATPVGREPTALRLSLLGGFALSADGSAVPLQPGTTRVVAYAALQNRPVPRSVVAGTLWPETTDGRAAARLRSALWRLGGVDLVDVRQGNLSLAAGVDIDVVRLHACARTLLATPATASKHEPDPTAPAPQWSPAPADFSLFESELLPGWCEEWVIAERERLRILQLAALERIGQRLIDVGEATRALDVCLRLTLAEPLRETTHRLIVEAYLSQGNQAEAMRHYLSFRDQLWSELHVLPSPKMQQLLANARLPTGLPADRVPSR